jgi:hypothetical protein
MLSKSLILSILFLSGLSLGFGQDPKDTLYFKWDKDYILTDRTSSQEKKLMLTHVQKEQVENGIEGYFYILIDTILTGFKADTIRNLKREVERKEYYFEKRHNRLVSKEKLIANLLDDHVTVLVKEDKLVIPNDIHYQTYFPRRINGFRIDNRVKDTLVFTGGWKEIIDPHSGEIKFSIANGRKIQFYFALEEVLDRDSFSKLNISNQAFKGDLDTHLFQYQVQKDIRNVNNKEDLSYYFSVYVVYFVKDGDYYKVYGMSYEI